MSHGDTIALAANHKAKAHFQIITSQLLEHTFESKIIAAIDFYIIQIGIFVLISKYLRFNCTKFDIFWPENEAKTLKIFLTARQ
jgi:hypothetical protein